MNGLTCLPSLLLLITAVSVLATRDDLCYLPSDTGPCRASIPRFFYNAKTGRCQRFVYGGCRGNDNRFRTMVECELRCASPQPQFPSSKSNCNLPKQPGFCRAYFPSYFYNTDTGKCEYFVYGGCNGNANRFSTELGCKVNCILSYVCRQPKVVGRCRASFPRWFFNMEKMRCEQFTYGGCWGNHNRFLNRLACERRCNLQSL